MRSSTTALSLYPAASPFPDRNSCPGFGLLAGFEVIMSAGLEVITEARATVNAHDAFGKVTRSRGLMRRWRPT
jgi:hypothetical protein